MKIPDGLQQHAIFRMDGRIWIEPVFPPETETQKIMREKKIERGWMTMIPPNTMEVFVSSL